MLFAGYRMPHPLELHIELRVQTDETTTPKEVIDNAILMLTKDIKALKTQFEVCLSLSLFSLCLTLSFVQAATQTQN